MNSSNTEETDHAHGDVDVQSTHRYIETQLIETINATAHTYQGIPGLIREILWYTLMP